MRRSPDTLYAFVIDTNSYAGNFERPLVAACTGQYGWCEVGRERAEKFEHLYPTQYAAFREMIVHVPDDHGCLRPASIYPTPGFWNDGLGNDYPDAEWGQQHTIDTYRKAIVEHGAAHLDPNGSMPGRHPAYHSVAAFFSERPTPKQVDFMIERAKEFVPDRFEGSFAITGFRVVEEKMVQTTLWST